MERELENNNKQIYEYEKIEDDLNIKKEIRDLYTCV
jgi:hypothetical protein